MTGGFGPGEDVHWLQADDYFVGKEAYQSGWQYVELAKMKQPPSPGTKGEALFFLVDSGSDRWSGAFYKTRPAEQPDLVLGNLAICFNSNQHASVYQAPKDKNSARGGRWWIARITDVSDIYKGYATLSGRYPCATAALRVPVQ